MNTELSPDEAALLDRYVQDARGEHLDPERLERLQLRLMALTAGTTTAALGAKSLTGVKTVNAWLLLKVGGGVGVTVAAGLWIAAMNQVRRVPRQEVPPPTVASRIDLSTGAESVPTANTTPEPAVVNAAVTEPAVSVKQTTRASAHEAASELELLREARAALRTEPSLSLSLCARHARSYPSGQLAEEREVVRIEALTRLGRQGEAAARARQFQRGWPDSAYRSRVEELTR